MITFQSEEFDYLQTPKTTVVQQMAPALFEVRGAENSEDSNKLKLHKTPEADRFLSREKDALPQSALHELRPFNRPFHGIKKEWNWVEGKVPVHTIPATLVATSDPAIAKDFLDDLRNTFSWENDECFAMYMGYLIQPMVCHLYSGQLPGYAFKGPTRSGKGYLASALPNTLYRRPGAATVAVKKLPQGDYELDVFLYGVKDVVFVVFDEVMLAEAIQFKLLDALLTETVVQIRKLHGGYTQIPNHFTIALTAVEMSVTDETDGRLASIRLTKSKAEEIDSFHRRWSGHGAELLASLFEIVQNVKIDLKTLPQIPNRRPGFGLVAHILSEGFALKASYPLEGGNTDLLDSISQLYEEIEPTKTSGSWKNL